MWLIWEAQFTDPDVQSLRKLEITRRMWHLHILISEWKNLHLQEIQREKINPTGHPLTTPVRAKEGEGQRASWCNSIKYWFILYKHESPYLNHKTTAVQQIEAKRGFLEAQRRCQRSGTEAKNYLIVSIIIKMIAYKKIKTCMYDWQIMRKDNSLSYYWMMSETAMQTTGGDFFIQSHGKVCIVPKYSSKIETS